MKRNKTHKNTASKRNGTFVKTSAERIAEEEKKKALEIKRENDRAHRRRVNSASDKRALPTAFTKGYYRFAKNYPSTVTENGDRLNEPTVRERPTALAFIAGAVALLLFFAVAFVVTDTAIGISRRETATQPETQESPPAPKAQNINAVSFDLSNITADLIIQECSQKGCNAVCLDFKDDGGFINFISKAGAGDSAMNASLNAADIVDLLHAANLKVIMRVSCFLDTTASNANSSWAALTGENGGVWYDSDSRAWLNPYSQDAVNYLINVISEASASGADYILLDNVCFSPQTKTGSAYYPGESTSSLTPNSVLRQVVTTACAAAENSEVILSCSIQGFTGNYGENYSFYAGNLLDTQAAGMACDMRLSVQAPSLKIGSAFFERASDIPYVFVLTASEYAVSAVANSSSLFAIIEQSDTVQNELNAVAAAGIDNYIIMQ